MSNDDQRLKSVVQVVSWQARRFREMSLPDLDEECRRNRVYLSEARIDRDHLAARRSVQAMDLAAANYSVAFYERRLALAEEVLRQRREEELHPPRVEG